MPAKEPVLQPAELAAAVDPTAAGSALTADWSALNSSVVGASASRAEAVQEAPLLAARVEEARPIGETTQAALRNTVTGYLVAAGFDNLEDGWYQPDANFDINREYSDILDQFQIQDTDDNLKALAGTTSSAQAYAEASRIKEKEQREAMLAHHGALAFTAEVLDPTTMLVDWATFGLGRAARLGRAGFAVAGAGTSVGLTGIADVAGKDYEMLDYVLSAAVTGGAFAVFGPEAKAILARNQALGAVPPTPLPAGVVDIPQLVMESSNLDDIRTLAQGTPGKPYTLKDGTPVQAVDTVNAYGDHVLVLHRDGELVGELAFTDAEVSGVDSLVTDAFQRKGAATLLYDLALERGAKISGISGPDTGAVRTPAGAAFRGTFTPGSSKAWREASTSAPMAPTPVGPGAAIPARKQRWYQPITEFLSETDKLIGHSDEAAALLADMVDDPVRREGILRNSNAASVLRRNANWADGLLKSREDALSKAIGERTGMGYFTRTWDFSGKFGEARDVLNREVADELLRRNSEFSKYGAVSPARIDPVVTKLADEYEQLMTAGARDLAQAQGLKGFEDFTPQPGYFHRAWDEARMRRVQTTYGKPFLQGLIGQAAQAGMQMTAKEGKALATAIMSRMEARASGLRAEFMGSLGKTDTDGIREMLASSGASAAEQKSIMRKIEQNVTEAGKIKYSKSRLPLDMTVSAKAPDGTVVQMADLIDTDLSRLAENYMQSLAGRAALSRVGIGGDDASIEAFRKKYRDTLDRPRKPLAQDQIDERMLALDHLIGDFTGTRPEQALLSNLGQRAKSLAHSTMLSASGLWQVAENATIAYRYGAAQATGEFIKQFPGVATILRKAGRDPDLYEEMQTVLGLDLARDVRVRPWLKQHEVNLSASSSTLDRVLFMGQQATPILNAMKFVHTHQARMNSNLAVNTLVRATFGDKRALKLVHNYGLRGQEWTNVQDAIRSNAKVTGKNANQMNWGAWDQNAVDSAMNAALRMMDDTVLYGRAGQGASFSRSAVGQLLGQFRSFVSLAQNKLLRGTVENEGVIGYASMLAYQYPLTMLMVSLNELRKGEDVDFSEEGLLKLSGKAISYTAGLGYIGDVANVVGLTGGRGGMSAPVLGLANAGVSLAEGSKSILTGEVQEGLGDYMQAARTVLPIVGIFPGSAALQKTFQE